MKILITVLTLMATLVTTGIIGASYVNEQDSRIISHVNAKDDENLKHIQKTYVNKDSFNLVIRSLERIERKVDQIGGVK